MRDGGKGDTPRPLGVSMEVFDANFDRIFGTAKFLREHIKEVNAEFDKAYEEYKKEPIPFAGMVDIEEDKKEAE